MNRRGKPVLMLTPGVRGGAEVRHAFSTDTPALVAPAHERRDSVGDSLTQGDYSAPPLVPADVGQEFGLRQEQDTAFREGHGDRAGRRVTRACHGNSRQVPRYTRRGVALDIRTPFSRLWSSFPQASHDGGREETGMGYVLIASVTLLMGSCLAVVVLKRPVQIGQPFSAGTGNRPVAGLTAHLRRSRRGRACVSPPLPSTAPLNPGPDLTSPALFAGRESVPVECHVNSALGEAPPYSPLELRHLLQQRPPDFPRES
jgi:hypothetical protein